MRLTEDELMLILTETRNAMVKQYTKLLAMEGVNLVVTRDALRALAHQAVTKGTGARALRSMFEKIMLDVMYEVPKQGRHRRRRDQSGCRGREASAADQKETGQRRGVEQQTDRSVLLTGCSHRAKRVLRCSFHEAQSFVRVLEPVAYF